MTTTVKAVAGVLGAAAIGAGGIVMSKFGGESFNHETSWHSLAEDGGYSDSSYSGKFAEKLTRYFVGPGVKDNTTKTSKPWWDWSFKGLVEDKLQNGKFSVNQLKESYSSADGDDESLNNVCDKAYKSEPSNVVDSGSDNNKFNKSEVWKYCSPIGQEPKTIDKHNGADNNEKQSGTIGESEKSTLISVADEGNKVFWEIREKEFKDPSFNVGASHKFFSQGKTDQKHIKDLCKEAYEKKTSDASPTKEETKKYCSLDPLTNSK